MAPTAALDALLYLPDYAIALWQERGAGGIGGRGTSAFRCAGPASDIDCASYKLCRTGVLLGPSLAFSVSGDSSPPLPPPWSQPWVAVPYIAFLSLLNGWLAIYGEPFSLAALMFLMVGLY